jgi:hypothetical protein
MNRDVSQFLQQAEAVISELTDEIRAEIEAAERQAFENVSRFFELQEEAKQAEDRTKLLWAELERLPSEHRKAVLNSDRTGEQQLTGRYKAVKSELAALRVRVPEIEREMRRLCSRQSLPDGWHRHDPYLYQQARVAKTFGVNTPTLQAAKPTDRRIRQSARAARGRTATPGVGAGRVGSRGQIGCPPEAPARGFGQEDCAQGWGTVER